MFTMSWTICADIVGVF